MRRAAEAIVVGSGVICASIAFNLTRLGLRDVVAPDPRPTTGRAHKQAWRAYRTSAPKLVNWRGPPRPISPT